jgi:hypothetical protein
MAEWPADKDASCQYIVQVVAESRQGAILYLWGLGEVLTTPHHKNLACCETCQKASDLEEATGKSVRPGAKESS